jgi:hypothetical protein
MLLRGTRHVLAFLLMFVHSSDKLVQCAHIGRKNGHLSVNIYMIDHMKSEVS